MEYEIRDLYTKFRLYLFWNAFKIIINDPSTCVIPMKLSDL